MYAALAKKYKAPSRFYYSRGLTLVELIVVMAVFGIIAGAFSLNYAKYTKRQTLKQEALTLKQTLRLVQSKARTGDKTGCGSNQLFGWRVNISPENGGIPASVTYQIACPTGSDVTGPIETIQFKPGITFNTASIFFFRPLTLSVSDVTGVATSESIELTNGTHTCTIAVESNGEISDKGCLP